MGFFSRFFPARALADVGSGREVVIDATVVGPNTLQSTISPVGAVAIRWTLLYEQHERQGRGGGNVEQRFLHAFLWGWHGERLLLRAACGRVIEVPLGQARLEATVDPQDGTPLGSTPQSSRMYGELARGAPTDVGMTYVREHCITAGQPLRLKAFVEPLQRGGGYREAVQQEHDFRAVRNVIVRDM